MKVAKPQVPHDPSSAFLHAHLAPPAKPGSGPTAGCVPTEKSFANNPGSRMTTAASQEQR